MNGRLVAAVGTGVTGFLLVSGALTEALAARIAFSAIVALPIGVVAGAVAGISTWTRLWSRPGLRPMLLGVSAVGYAVLVAAAVAYAVPPARGFVSTGNALGFSGLCGLGAFLLVRRFPERFER